MNFSTMKLAFAAAVLGAGALSAQEMGAVPAASAVVPAKTVASAVSAQATPADGGPQIVVILFSKITNKFILFF